MPQGGLLAQRVLLVWLVMQLRQMATAGLGGIGATVVDMSSLIVQVKLSMPVAVAAFLSAAAGACVGFLMNKHIAFRDRSPITLSQVTRFGGVAVATALLMAIAMQLLSVNLGLNLVVAKVVCSALVFAAWTYPAQRRFVFARPQLSPWMSLS